MQVGFVGAGLLPKTFGRHLINAGHAIVDRTFGTYWVL